MCWNKCIIALLALFLAAFSFAAGGLAQYLAGDAKGREIYKVGAQTYTEQAAEDELAVTISLHPGIKPSERDAIKRNTSFRAAFLRNRYSGDVLAALAEKSGLLSSPEAHAWLRIAAREAVKQLCMTQMASNVTVSSNEIIEYYDANAAALAHLPLSDALTLAEERLLMQKKQEALYERIIEAEDSLPAHLFITNW
ncbi:MAG: hypothetical protein LBC99_00825 [Spirochaetota bacterium]|jgi:hypothetical protein|nr:hypothetical protein [Spirochaetota bacterium]